VFATVWMNTVLTMPEWGIAPTTDLRKLEKLRVKGVAKSECAYAERLHWGVRPNARSIWLVSTWGLMLGMPSVRVERVETTGAGW